MAVMIMTTIFSLRGLASQAEYGYTSVFWYTSAALLFLVPFSMVCAELASTFPGSGGIFRWCSEAFGPRWGWAAMYLEWITLVIWFPSVLMFGSSALAYAFAPAEHAAAVASNPLYTLAVVLGVYWLSTLNCLRGLDKASRLSVLGGLVGTIIPAAVLITLSACYLLTGGVNHIPANRPFLPDFSQYGTIVLAASIFLFYGGMEMQAVHVNRMERPRRSFPRAVLIAAASILAAFILGTLAIAAVMPQADINILESLLVAYNTLFGYFGVEWIGSVIAFMIALGVVGQVSVILAGPSTGMLAVGRAGYLPAAFHRVNSRGVQANILWAQGAIVTAMSLVLIVLPNVQSAYQIMSQMATVIYLAVVILVYATFLRLRHTQPHATRGFKVPGGRLGKWGVATVGIGGALAALVISLLPPEQIAVGSPTLYVGLLVGGTTVIIATPFVIYAFRRPSWVGKDSDTAAD